MADKKNASKKPRRQNARLEELRREQRRSDRRRQLVVWGSVAVVVLLVVGTVTTAILLNRKDRPSLAAVTTAAYTGGEHVQGPVTYKETPPVGGPHNPVWLNCGVYTAPVPNENAVHSLEHGAVWITYRPDLPADQVATLTRLTPATYAVLSPYPGLPAPVVVSSWNHQLRLTGADDPRLPAFITAYRQGPDTPEPGAVCTGGTDGSSR